MRKFSVNDKCIKCRYYCKKFIAFLFSHIGLCALVVGYVILGAITFSYLEAPAEVETKERVQGIHNATLDAFWNTTEEILSNFTLVPVDYTGRELGPYDQLSYPPPSSPVLPSLSPVQLERLRRDVTRDLWNITLEMNVLFEKNWTTLVNERIMQYQAELMAMLLNETRAMLVNDTLARQNASAAMNNSLFITPNYTAIQTDYTDLEDRVKESLRPKLYHYDNQIFHQVRHHGYDGDARTGPDAVPQWTITGGLLYSLTVITTIGYGHITPKTVWGKLITMLYAIIGIPLMLLCLANIGDALAHAFKFFYWKVCCLYCEIKKRRTRLMRIQSVRMSRKSTRSPGASMVNNVGPMHTSMHSSFRSKPPSLILPEKPKDLRLSNPHNSSLVRISSTPESRSLIDQSPGSPDASAITEVATTSITDQPEVTVTNEDNNEESNKPDNKSVIVPIAMEDEADVDMKDDRLTVVLPGGDRKMSVCNMPPESIDGIDYVDESPQPSPTHLSPDETTAVIVHDVQDDDDQMGRDFEPTYERRSVPVYVCLLVVFGYIMGGALLFAGWEGWYWFDGAYFCFITLTTIGFGDFVPGVGLKANEDEPVNQEQKLGLCSLYLVFGMALLAMSFNLVQEAATEKAKWIARKIGLLSDDSEEED